MRALSYIFVILTLFLSACQPVLEPALPTTPPPPTPADTPITPPPQPTAALTSTSTPAPVEPPTPIPTLPPAAPQEMPIPDGSTTLVQAAQHGGEITAMAIENGIAFIGVGPSLRTFSLDENAPIEQEESGFSLNFLAHDLAVQEGILYLLDGEGHLFMFDVKNPPVMYVLQAFEGAGTSRVFVNEGWGFTTTDTCAGGNCTSLLQLFPLDGLAETQPVFGADEIGPTLPIQAALDISGGILDVLVAGELVYIAHQGGLVAASLPDLQVQNELKAQFVSGAAFALPYAYLTGNELLVADLSDPQSLNFSRPDDGGSFPAVSAPMVIAGDHIFGFDTFGEFGHCSSELRALSLVNPAAPAPVGLDGGAPGLICARQVKASGSQLLVIDWHGLHFLDISNPTAPRLIGSYTNTPGHVDLVHEGWAFGGSDLAPASLWSHDLRDLEEIRSYGPAVPRWAIDMQAEGEHLFAPVWEDGLAVVDISDPTAPTLAGGLTAQELGGAGLDVDLQGSFLYVARGETGVGIVDISEPSQPALVGEIPLTQPEGSWQRTSRVSAGEDFLVVLDEIWQGDLPRGVLRILRLEDPANPAPTGEIEIEEPFLRSGLASDDTYAYLMTSLCQTSCTHRLLIVDLDSPAVTASFHLPGEAHNVSLSGAYLFVAAGRDGVYVWNVSDPAHPFLAAHADTPGTAVKAVAQGEWVYVSDEAGGLVVFQMNE